MDFLQLISSQTLSDLYQVIFMLKVSTASILCFRNIIGKQTFNCIYMYK